MRHEVHALAGVVVPDIREELAAQAGREQASQAGALLLRRFRQGVLARHVADGGRSATLPNYAERLWHMLMQMQAAGVCRSRQWGSKHARCSLETKLGASVRWKQALKPMPYRPAARTHHSLHPTRVHMTPYSADPLRSHSPSTEDPVGP